MTNIKYIKGNIFTTQCQTLVNTVNCVGVMGAGIALEFKYRYPIMFEKYVSHCKANLIEIGKLWIYDIPNSENKVLNFPTKRDWKFPSKYEYLERGLKRFLETYKEKKITSIAFPMLGALNGGLDPEKVRDLMYSYLSLCDIPVEIYEYDAYSSDDLVEDLKKALLKKSVKELEAQTRLRKETILKLKDATNDGDFVNLMQLKKIRGISEETLKNCFSFAMDLKNNPKNEVLNIFDNNPIEPVVILEKQIEIPIKDNVIIPSPKKVAAKKNNKVEIPILEKCLLTGLDEQTIIKIESKETHIMLDSIINYCNGLNLNLGKFMTQNYK